MIEFKLPSLGSDMDEGKLLAWHIQPGDTVKRGQVVAVVDTSKAAVDVEIWQDGTVAELLVQPGETVPVGTVLATVLEEGEDAGAMALRSGAGAVPMPSASAPNPAPSPATTPDTARPGRAAGAASAVATTVIAPATASGAERARRRISPAARKKAGECGINVDTLTGTGADGAITLQDVEAAAQAAKAAQAVQAPPADRHAEMRKAIAAAMSRSKREIPHYYLSEPVPMRAALDWLAATNPERPITERLLLAVLQLKAVALALHSFPDMNGYYRDGAFQPVAAAHVGVAIALRQGGLVAPALLDAANKPLDQLMRELSDLVRRARAGSLRSSEMGDATITVTNLGEQGVEMVSGVIYPPQVALVGFGRLTDRPWVRDGGLCVMPAVTASLAADHRVTDGHRGALFLAAIRDLLQNPAAL
ncbi:2-oxo acid dehydrogenase subunit E2 [Duganella sp. LX20W]|uniref:Dihydrolipoamide acetyltransferase component of pyruvate dehydrogenase complex n=1 Tax=Rugamonas brunnea TaxID=2758569 RepID=A0A7W2ESF3_9BURK|nr:dihydrolipoamide acetyltransferase family protein [Rugamonas brunnea]MBA5637669.1 2-oxo acid dehydrogenase subunit E2 [Rugamonas brunnea]